MDRAAYLTALLGRPWAVDGEGPETFSCYGLFREVQRALWARDLPHIDVPPEASRRWIVEAIARHDERRQWREVPLRDGIVTASDGAGVIMARVSQGAHIGVWCAAEGRILHADDRLGVVFERPTVLRARGWGRLAYFEPIQD